MVGQYGVLAGNIRMRSLRVLSSGLRSIQRWMGTVMSRVTSYSREERIRELVLAITAFQVVFQVRSSGIPEASSRHSAKETASLTLSRLIAATRSDRIKSEKKR